jgi:hypothetical protein
MGSKNKRNLVQIQFIAVQSGHPATGTIIFGDPIGKIPETAAFTA